MIIKFGLIISAFILTPLFISTCIISKPGLTASGRTPAPNRTTATEIAIKTSSGLVPIPDQTVEIDYEKARLGMRLFNEKSLSRDKTVSCASCHDLATSGADKAPFSRGVNGQLGDSNAPTVFNSSLNFRQFWDGRASSLEEQIDGPIRNPKEMNSDWPSVLRALASVPAYRKSFESAFSNGITQENVVKAITEFERALVTRNSPFDRYLNGENKALSDIQVRGLRKFESYGCVSCHQGVGVGGNMFQNFGVMGDYFKDRGGTFPSDAGRFKVTGKTEDLHFFKVPSLRNVALTAPYFHDGHAKTLEEAVKIMGTYQLGLALSEEDVKDLVKFLESLTGERPSILGSAEKQNQ